MADQTQPEVKQEFVRIDQVKGGYWMHFYPDQSGGMIMSITDSQMAELVERAQRAQDKARELGFTEAVNKYTVHIVWIDEDSGYIATSPSFRLMSAFGDTKQEALQEFEKVLNMALEAYAKLGWESPEVKQ